MAEKLGEAVLELRTDDRQLESGIKKAERDAEGLAAKFDAFGGRARNAGALLSVGLTAPIGLFAVEAVKAAKESAEATGQVEAALASMGNASGHTLEQLQALAANQMGHSLNDDDEILRKVTANLLTFGNVAGEAFDRGQQAAIDMSARLGTDLQGAAITVGKALNDPIAGISALTRTGVQFTEQQKEQIKAMVEAGDRAGAQKMILGELERQFGGAAQAMRDADPGAALKQSFAELQENIGGKILPLLPPLMNGLGAVLDAFGSLPSGVQSFTIGLLATSAAIGPMLIGIGSLASGFGALLPVLAGLGPVIGIVSKALLGLLANPIVLAAAAVIAGIYLAWQNWDKIAPILSAVGAAVTGWWNDNVKPVLDWVLEKLRFVTDFFRDYFAAGITGVVQMVSALLRGDFSGAWQAAKQAVYGMVTATLTLFSNMTAGAIGAVRALYDGVRQWVQDRLGAVFDWLKGKLEAVGGYFYDLYDKVVGHSYIPDMVDQIGQHIGRLDGELAQPVEEITVRAGRSFADMARSVAGSIDGMINKLRSGDILGAMEDLISLAGQVGDAIGKIGGAALGGKVTGGIEVAGGLLSLGKAFSGFFADGGMIPKGSFGIVGERGPEPVIGTGRGAMVLPNSSLSSGSFGGGGGKSVVELRLRDELLDAIIRNVSGDMALQVVRETAPAIVDASAAETTRRLGRPRM